MEWRIRNCANPECRRPIEACNGFVKAGDINEAIDGTRPWREVRELCGKCGAYIACLEMTGRDQEREEFFIKIGYAEAPRVHTEVTNGP